MRPLRRPPFPRARDGARVLALSALWALTACGTESACGPSAGTVLKAVDGDTVVLASGERVRYLMVDTPESTGGKSECFGAEASAFNRALTEGKLVQLRYAEACTDRYGRLLAYVMVDGREVNTLLVERGYACVLYVPPAGESRRIEYQSLEAAARQARRGLWGACSPLPCGR
jgi:micrococcal nuclease